MKFEIWHRVEFEFFCGEIEAKDKDEAEEIAWSKLPLTRDGYTESEDMVIEVIPEVQE